MLGIPQGISTASVIEREQRGEELRRKLADPSIHQSHPVIGPLIRSQRQYILWHLLFLVLHLAELVVLALVHRVYFPPESLFILRVCSSLSVLSSVVAFGISMLPEGARDSSRPSIVSLGRLIFQISLAAVAVLTILLTFGGALSFTSPVIFRVLVFSVLFTLPFDVLTQFLFVNQGRLPGLIGMRSSRAWLVLGDVVSLWCLYQNLPLLCLVARVVPRVLLALGLWRSGMARPIRELFISPLFTDVTERKGLMHLWRNCRGGILAALALELWLYMALYAMQTQVEGLQVLVFVFHKVVHFGFIIGVRLGFRQPRIWTSADPRLRNESTAFAIMRTFWVGASAAIVSLLFAPALWLQKDIVLWSSHLGERYVPSLVLWGAFLVAGLLKVVVFSGVTIVTMKSTGWRLGAVLGVGLLLLGGMLFGFMHVPNTIEVEHALLMILLTEALLLVAIAGVVFRLGSRQLFSAYESRLESGAMGQLAALSSYLATIGVGGPGARTSAKTSSGALLYLKAMGPWRTSLREVLHEPLHGSADASSPLHVDVLLPLSGYQSLVLLSAPADWTSQKLEGELVSRLGGNLETLTLLSHGHVLLTDELRSVRDAATAAAWLLSLVRRGRTLPVLSAEQEEVVEAVCSLFFSDKAANDASSRETSKGVQVWSVAEHRGATSALRQDDQTGELLRYGAEILRDDRIIDPSVVWKRQWKGHVHSFDRHGIYSIGAMNDSLRPLKAYIEDAILLRSFTQTIAPLFRGGTKA